MLEALTISTKGGLVLYHYRANPSLVGDDNDGTAVRASTNQVIQKVLMRDAAKTFHIIQRLTFAWKHYKDLIVVAVYPDIMFEGPRQYLKQWAETLLEHTVTEYAIYYKAKTNSTNGVGGRDFLMNSLITERPDPKPFDQTFQVILEQSKNSQSNKPPNDTPSSPSSPSSSSQQQQQQQQPTGNKGKEKRHWHDGNAKVTEKAMAELDMSAPSSNDEEAKAIAYQRALEEARRTYLPSEAELVEEETSTNVIASNSNLADKDDDSNSNSSWSSSVTGLLQQLTGNKVLTSSDLERPLERMRDLLTSKNVAREIAVEVCDSVRSSLVGKRLNSLYRVQTAVRQATEKVVSKVLSCNDNRLDLLRAVLTKRGSSDGLFSFGSKRQKLKKAPYVIVVMGINGIGKTTSLAKLAYYFQKNGCRPLLVAGDTFRSGAVEQLQVHATCLDVPLYSQGYSKDPSGVAKAAIQHATEQGNDVVLVDTAGRMQNNVPLMKALGKLVQENKPDCILLVAEALVGHDGLDQFAMFRRAVAGPGRTIDGLILTKYDTVSDKVGAALTLTHETKSPIVFVGTGQKYHHLKTLSAESVINSLFS